MLLRIIMLGRTDQVRDQNLDGEDCSNDQDPSEGENAGSVRKLRWPGNDVPHIVIRDLPDWSKSKCNTDYQPPSTFSLPPSKEHPISLQYQLLHITWT